MKFSKTIISAAVILSSTLTASAFSPTPSYTTQRQQQTRTSKTSHNIVSDPYLISSAVDADIIGQLALILPVGLGIAMGNSNSKGHKSNADENVDLAVLGGSAVAVLDEVEEEEETATPEVTPAQRGFFGKKKAAVVEKKEEPEPEPEKDPEPEPVPVVTAKPGKASIPSKELLASTEKAKAEVQKKGVQETKDKMISKLGEQSSPVEEEKEVAAPSTEVVETKKPGRKRRLAKGVTLIVAAGAVALARNVVKAYLGRGVL